MKGADELRAWARRRNLSYREAVRQLIAIAEGRDIPALLCALKQRYTEGMTPTELGQLDVLYSWLGYVFSYRAPEPWSPK